MAIRSIRETGNSEHRGWRTSGSVVRLLVSVLGLGLAWSIGGGNALESVIAISIVTVVHVLVERRIDRGAPFGLPNGITWIRLVGTAYLAGITGVALSSPVPEGSWIVVAVASAAAALDGLDGWLARRFGPDTPFGARFDMETDALLILVLAIFAAATGKVGAWILLAGLMRYAFVAAAVFYPWLASPLPPSFRRKLVCVVQIVGLIAIAAPVVDGIVAAAIGGATLAALCWSFAVDVVWLWRNRGTGL